MENQDIATYKRYEKEIRYCDKVISTAYYNQFMFPLGQWH